MASSIALDLSLRRLRSVLCPLCQDIFDHEDLHLFDQEKKAELQEKDVWDRASSDYEKSTVRSHQKNISTLAQYAEHGCYICNIVWRHFFPEKTLQQYREAPYFLRTDRMGRVQSHAFLNSGTHYILGKPDKSLVGYSKHVVELKIGLNSPINEDRHIPEYKTLMLSPLEEELRDGAGLGLDFTFGNPPCDEFDATTIETIQAWVRKCRSFHSSCDEYHTASWYPTRLLDVRALVKFESDRASRKSSAFLVALESDTPGIKLIETRDANPTGPYIALTHRWERVPSIKTTRGNYKSMTQSIDETALPLVFRQAINIARKLDVRYLWIDSLCIIQEDEEDWVKEVKQMGQVYMNSYLTLSATAGGGRLIQPRDGRQIHPCIRSPRWRGSWPRHYMVTDFRFWDERIYRALTNTRCWITQERWLSPRVLHFTFDQLVWECRELEACETFFGGLPKETKLNRHTAFKQKQAVDGRPKIELLKRLPTDANADAIVEHYSLWLEWIKVLETYGRTETTYPRDRLLGLNLIGAQFAPKMNDELVAGLWRQSLPGDMLWHVAKSRRSNHMSNDYYGEATAQDLNSSLLNSPSRAVADSVRPDQYCAPSWSWASVLGDIEPGKFLFPGRDEAMIDVLDVQMEYNDPSEPVRGMKHGTLTLRGRLYPIHVEGPERRWDMPTLYIAGLPKTVHYIGEDDPLRFERESHRVFVKPDQPEEYTGAEDCCFLPVALQWHPSSNMRKAYLDPVLKEHLGYIDGRLEVADVSGLFVKPTQSQGEYRRMGVINFSLERSELFVTGFKAWKEAGFGSLEDSHPTSLRPHLYHKDEPGMLTII